MKRIKPKRSTQKELTAICQRMSRICKEYDPRIICEVTDIWPDYEDALRSEYEKRGIDPVAAFGGKQNNGVANVVVHLPAGIELDRAGLASRLSDDEDVCRVFVAPAQLAYRFEGAVRSDDVDVKDDKK